MKPKIYKQAFTVCKNLILWSLIIYSLPIIFTSKQELNTRKEENLKILTEIEMKIEMLNKMETELPLCQELKS